MYSGKSQIKQPFEPNEKEDKIVFYSFEMQLSLQLFKYFSKTVVFVQKKKNCDGQYQRKFPVQLFDNFNGLKGNCGEIIYTTIGSVSRICKARSQGLLS